MVQSIYKQLLIITVVILLTTLPACIGSSAVSNNAANVQVTLSDFKIDSSQRSEPGWLWRRGYQPRRIQNIRLQIQTGLPQW